MSDEKSKAHVSTEPYKGVRDFYPEDQSVLRYILDTMSKAAQAFGYQEYGASPIEPTELYQGKTSEEIVNEQTYSFTDRGGRNVTLRPEMTPTVARLIAQRRKSLSFPVRLYSTPNVFRYERPQRGRLREHFQLNADLFGVENIDAEVEIITLAHTLLTSFGLNESQFVIKINDRRALNNLLSQYNLSEEQKESVIRILDKKDKLEPNKFEESIKEITRGEMIDFNSIHSNDVDFLIEELKEAGITNTEYDKNLARGFDYYTGIVFEIFDTNPQNPRSLFGGGRYDNLLSVFGEEPVPTVGFGAGDVVLRDVLETYNLLPQSFSYSDVYVAIYNRDQNSYAKDISQKLRTLGIRTTLDLKYDSLGNQIKRAVSGGNTWVVIIGENEIIDNTYSLKNLSTQEQLSLNETQLIRTICNT